MIQLLPSGFEYVGKQGQGRYDENLDEGQVGQPEVVENFKNTGRTAVIYTIPKFIHNNGSIDDISIATRIRATAYA